jgi:hypothetical protein
MSNLRVSLSAVACACALLSACGGGPSGTGTAGTSGGGTAGTGTAGNGAAGTSGVAGNGTAGSGVAGTSGAAGQSGTAGNGVAGTSGSAGTMGSAGTTGTAGSSGGRGGTGGSAGTTGSGGTTGAAGNGGRGGAGAGGRGGQGAAAGAAGGIGGSSSTGFFSDDFETGTVGMQPPGWMNFIAYQANNTNPNGTTLAIVDSTRAHSGTKSVHVHGGSSPAQLTRTLPTGTNKLYVRAWIYQTRQLGSMNQSENHETLIAIRKVPGSVENEVRFGEIKGSIGTNLVPGDDFSPPQSQPGTLSVAPNRWACIEVAFLADQPQHTLYAWADGTLVHSITGGAAQWGHGLTTMNWMAGMFVEVVLGWQSFSGIDTDLWIDDVVLSTAPIGCN